MSLDKAKITDQKLKINTYNGIIERLNTIGNEISDDSIDKISGISVANKDFAEDLKWAVQSINRTIIGINVGEFVLNGKKLTIPYTGDNDITDAYTNSADYGYDYDTTLQNYYKISPYILIDIPVTKYTDNDTVPAVITSPTYTTAIYGKRPIYICVGACNYNGTDTFGATYGNLNYGFVYITNCKELAGLGVADGNDDESNQIRYINKTCKAIAEVFIYEDGDVAEIKTLHTGDIKLDGEFLDDEKATYIISDIDSDNKIPTFTATFDNDSTQRKTLAHMNNDSYEASNKDITQLKNVELMPESSKGIPYLDTNCEYGSDCEVSGELKWASVDADYCYCNEDCFSRSLEIRDTGVNDHLNCDNEKVLQLYNFDASPSDSYSLVVSNHSDCVTCTNHIEYINVDKDLTICASGDNPTHCVDNCHNPISLEFSRNTESGLNFLSLYGFAEPDVGYNIDCDNDKVLMRAFLDEKPILKYATINEFANAVSNVDSCVLCASDGICISTSGCYDPDVDDSFISVNWDCMPSETHHELGNCGNFESQSHWDDHGGARVDGYVPDGGAALPIYQLMLLGNPMSCTKSVMYDRNKDCINGGASYIGNDLYVEDKLIVDGCFDISVGDACSGAMCVACGGASIACGLQACEYRLVCNNDDFKIDQTNTTLASNVGGTLTISDFRDVVATSDTDCCGCYSVGDSEKVYCLYDRFAICNRVCANEYFVTSENVDFLSCDIKICSQGPIEIEGTCLVSGDGASNGVGITTTSTITKYINGIAVEALGNSNSSSQTLSVTGNPNGILSINGGGFGGTSTTLTQNGTGCFALNNSGQNLLVGYDDCNIDIGSGEGVVTIATNSCLNVEGDIVNDGDISVGNDLNIGDSGEALFGDDEDYSINFDGSNAIHCTCTGGFVFTGGDLNVCTTSGNGSLNVKSVADDVGISLQNSSDQEIVNLNDEGGDGMLEIKDSAGTNKIRLFSNGASFISNDLGIGTASPDSILDIQADGDGQALTIKNSAGNNILRAYNDDDDGITWRLLDKDENITTQLSSEFGGDNYINNGGRLGIGTNDPDELLHIFDGSDDVKLKMESDDDYNIYFDLKNCVNEWSVGVADTTGNFVISDGVDLGTERLVIDTDGVVDIDKNVYIGDWDQDFDDPSTNNGRFGARLTNSGTTLGYIRVTTPGAIGPGISFLDCTYCSDNSLGEVKLNVTDDTLVLHGMGGTCLDDRDNFYLLRNIYAGGYDLTTYASEKGILRSKLYDGNGVHKGYIDFGTPSGAGAAIIMRDTTNTNSSFIQHNNSGNYLELSADAGAGDLYINAAAVGIGTNDAEYNLHVLDTTNPVASLMETCSDVDAYHIARNCINAFSAGVDCDGSYVISDSEDLDTDRLVIDTDGDVGIGTNDPDYKLHIVDANDEFLRLETTADAGNTLDLGYDGVNNVFEFTTSSRSFAFLGGNVGIGTDSPSAKLDIDSDSIIIQDTKTPANASATGITGQIAWDSDYIYVAVGTDTWKRAALNTW